MTTKSPWKDYSIFWIHLIINNFTYTTTESIFALFISIAFSTSHILTFLSKKILHSMERSSAVSTEIIFLELREWKRHHLLVCKLIDKVNDVFGFIVLMKISRTFVYFTMRIFYLVCNRPERLNLANPFFYAYWCSFVNSFFKLCLVIYSSHLINSKVIRSLLLTQKNLIWDI